MQKRAPGYDHPRSNSPVPQVWLASASPRRRQLLESLGLSLRVIPSHADETWPQGASAEGALVVARRKLDAASYPDEALVVAADTVVFLGERRFEKPLDDAEAREMLAALSGQCHIVTTGFVVRGGSGTEMVQGSVATRVWFRHLSAADIERYVASGDGRDKAGSYGIQGVGGGLVDRIEGSYTNVIGLPLPEVWAAIQKVSAP